MITTTTDHLEGYRITEYLGIVKLVLDEVSEEKNYMPTQWEFKHYPEGTDAIIDIKLSLAESHGDYLSQTAVLLGTAVKVEKIC